MDPELELQKVQMTVSFLGEIDQCAHYLLKALLFVYKENAVEMVDLLAKLIKLCVHCSIVSAVGGG